MDVIWTSGATDELTRLHHRLVDFDPEAGYRLLERIAEALDLLKSQPEMGSYFVRPTRKWLVARHYGLIYAPSRTRLGL